MPKASPFPGMDPWLERHWESVRHSPIQFARQPIAGQLPDGLFTAVEVISPTIKTQPTGRRQSHRKRQLYYEARVNLVEIDLLRAGRAMIDIPWDALEPWAADMIAAEAGR